MNGVIKKIKDIFPVTTTKAVYIDGTSKTLQDALNSGELSGGTTSTSGRGYCQIKLRGSKVFISEVVESSSAHNKIKYTFPTGDSNRLRRMYAYTPNAVIKNIEIPDGILALNEALVYNFDNNTLSTKTGGWGNIQCANNEIILLYNDYSGCVGGALSPYIVDYSQSFVPVLNKYFEVCSDRGNGLSQGVFIIGDYMYMFGASSDDRTTTLGSFDRYSLSDLNTIVHSGKHNLGHMNAPSYSSAKDMMIVGNGSKIYDQSSLPMEGYIFKNFKTVIENNPSNLVFENLDKVILNFSQFAGEYKCQLCWGEENTDIVYLLTCENTIIRKLLLTKDASGNYTGEYTVLGTFRSTVKGIVGGFKYHNGYLYTGVKGDYGIRKMKLCVNNIDSTLDGFIENEYIQPSSMVGTMQGIEVNNNILYGITDSKGYKINLSDIL